MPQEETGTVKWFDTTKGHGFITKDGGGEIFVHYNQINAREGHRDLYEGDRVSFIEMKYKGKVQASRVCVLSS